MYHIIVFERDKNTHLYKQDWKFKIIDSITGKILACATVEYNNNCYYIELIDSFIKRVGYGTILTNYIFDYFNIKIMTIHCCTKESKSLYSKKYKYDGRYIYIC